MSNIIRFYIPDAPVFITAVCYNRKPFLQDEQDKQVLLEVMREVKGSKPFSMVAYAIMDNHFHWIIVPGPTHDFSQIMQAVKVRFTDRYKRNNGIESETRIWQQRFWDHVIRDHEDMQRHIEYIHYNPVKHGRLKSPFDYQWSSFRTYVDRGYYPKEWASIEEPGDIYGMNFE